MLGVRRHPVYLYMPSSSPMLVKLCSVRRFLNGFKPYLEPPPFVFPAMRALAEPVVPEGRLSPLVLPRQQQLELVQELRVLVGNRIGHLLQTGVQAILRRMGRSPYRLRGPQPGRLPCRTFRPYRAVPRTSAIRDLTAYAGKQCLCEKTCSDPYVLKVCRMPRMRPNAPDRVNAACGAPASAGVPVPCPWPGGGPP